MKKLITIIVAGALTAAFAADPQPIQTQEFEQLKTQLQTQLHEALNGLNPDVKAQIEEAKMAAEQTQEKIQEMKRLGKTDAQVIAAMEQERTAAQQRLTTAIATLEQVSARVCAQVDKAKSEVQVRLQERTEELKQLQTRLREMKRLRDGTGSGVPTGEPKGSETGKGI